MESDTEATNIELAVTEKYSAISLAIIEVLQALEGEGTASQILGSIRGRRQDKVKFFRLMVSNREICRTGNGKRRDPYRYSLPVADKVISRTHAGHISPTSGETKIENIPRQEENLSKADFDNVLEFFKLLRQIQESTAAKK